MTIHPLNSGPQPLNVFFWATNLPELCIDFCQCIFLLLNTFFINIKPYTSTVTAVIDPLLSLNKLFCSVWPCSHIKTWKGGLSVLLSSWLRAGRGFSLSPRATPTRQMALAGTESVTVCFQGVLLQHWTTLLPTSHCTWLEAIFWSRWKVAVSFMLASRPGNEPVVYLYHRCLIIPRSGTFFLFQETGLCLIL